MINKIISLTRLVLGQGVARIMSGGAVSQVCGLVLSMALPYLLCESDFGAVRVVTAYMAVVLITGAFSLPVATASYIGRSKFPEDKSRYGTNALYMGFITSLFIGVLTIVLSWQWSFFSSQTVAMAFISRAGILFLSVLTLINLRALQAFGKIDKVAKRTASVGLAKLLFVVPLTKFFGIWGWMFGMGISDLIVFILTLQAIKPYLNFHRPRWKEISDLFRYSAVQVISGVAVMTAGNLDLMALDRMKVDLASIAYYGLAVMIFKQAAFPAEAFGVANFSRIGAICHDIAKLREYLKKMFIRMLAVISGVTVFMLLIVPFFIRQVYPSSYEASIPILRVLCISMPFLAMWGLISHVNIAIGKPWFEVLISTTGLIFMISSLYIFLSRLDMGLAGAAWSLNISYIAGALLGSGLLALHLSKNNIKTNGTKEISLVVKVNAEL